MEVLGYLAGIRTPLLEQVFSLITRFGEETVAVLLICTVFWCIDKKLGYGIGLSMFFSGLLVQGLKIGFRVDRPWILHPDFKPAKSAIAAATGYSFPSGHTQTATSVFVTLGCRIRQAGWKAALFFIPVAVGFSRMFLGVHTLQDVLTSLLLSTFISLIVVKLLMEKESPILDLWISGILGLASLIVMIFAGALHRSGMLEVAYMADSFKTAGSGLGFAIGYVVEKRWIRFSVKTEKMWMQPLKVIFGACGLLIIKTGLKAVLGDGAMANGFRYCLLIVWVLVIWPLMIRRFFRSRQPVGGAGGYGGQDGPGVQV